MRLVLAVNVCQAANAPTIIASLQAQWRKSGVASVNARLVARWDHEMIPLLHQASTCEGQALSLVSVEGYHERNDPSGVRQHFAEGDVDVPCDNFGGHAERGSG